MQPLSALDAVSPAFTRTHQTLFTPFRVGRSWKLAASSYVAIMGGFFFPVTLLLLFVPHSFFHPVALALLIIVPVLLGLILLYFGVRMQLVQFEMVVTRSRFIAPMWSRYGGRTWVWVGVKAALGTALTLAFAPALLARGRTMFLMLSSIAGMLPKIEPGVQQDPAAVQTAMFGVMGQMFAAVLPLYGLLFLLFVVLRLISTLLEDFALPFYILEECSFAHSLRSGLAVIQGDPVQVVLYLLLKFLLTLFGFVAQLAASQLLGFPLMLAGAVVGLIVGLIASLFGSGSQGHMVALGIGLTVGYGLIIVLSLWTQIFTLGYLSTLLEAYAIYFLGGRYARLGEYLVPSSTPFAPPPMPPGPDEDDGPPLPMDPALA